MALKAVSVPSLLVSAALLPLTLVSPALQRSAQAQLVWTTVDPTAPQPSAWGGTVVINPTTQPSIPAPATSTPLFVSMPGASAVPRSPAASRSSAAPQFTAATQSASVPRTPQPSAPSSWAAAPAAMAASPGAGATSLPRNGSLSVASASAGSAVPATTVTRVPVMAQSTLPPTAAASSPEELRQLRQQLQIPPLIKRATPWPSPSLSPGVPSAFVAGWGDVFLGVSGATPGKQRDGVVDGSFTTGFGLGSATKAIALEVSGGCGSVNNLCANGSFTARIGRMLINEPTTRVAIAGAWQNFAQWGNEGRQDNVYYGALSYGVPLKPGKSFSQTLQFNVGVGNSQYAPYVSEGSESQIGGFASVGLELTKFLGISAGWSGRGANAQLSITPFQGLPITFNVLGSDLFNQTPSGTVGILSISWGTNFLTPSF